MPAPRHPHRTPQAICTAKLNTFFQISNYFKLHFYVKEIICYVEKQHRQKQNACHSHGHDAHFVFAGVVSMFISGR